MDYRVPRLVVVGGGLGSLPGAVIASLLIGLVQNFAVSINGSLASIFGPHTVNAAEDPNAKAFGMRFNAASPLIWLLAAVLVIGGFVVARRTWRWVEKSWDEALVAAREKGFHA